MKRNRDLRVTRSESGAAKKREAALRTMWLTAAASNRNGVLRVEDALP
jgi:hypothetical protein